MSTRVARPMTVLLTALVVMSGILLGVTSKPAQRTLSHLWPPVVGQPYPDLELVDNTGRRVRLSSFRGKVLLIEPVGMNCPACQAFAGGHRHGSYQKISPQADLESIEQYFPQYTGGLSLSDSRIVHIQILFYSMTMTAPTANDVRSWAKHFRMDQAPNRVVLAGTPELINDATYNLIPGFQLVDKQFILRSDSTGHNPRHNLWNDLLPMVRSLVKEG